MPTERVLMRLAASSCLLAGVWLAGCGGSAGSGDPDPASEAGSSPASPASTPYFTDVTAATGIDFSIDRAVAGDYYMPDSMGSGCALLDYDGDGDLDVYVVNGFRDAAGRLSTPAGANRLYRQEPDGRFTDQTASSGAGDEGYGMGVAVGDVDNDGDVDLFVTNFGPNRLYRNDGDGTFTDVTAATGIDGDAWSASAGFFDYDGDGFLDLFVTNYLAYEHGGITRDAAGRLEYPSPDAFAGVADELYRNDGAGGFTDVSVAAGIAEARGRGLGVVFTDFDGDGHADVYVANDGQPNFAWINDGQGWLTDRAPSLGLAVNAFGMPEASMGIALGDDDNDGDDDLHLTHLVRESNTLYRRGPGGAFDDATMRAGLTAETIDSTGFGTAYLDVEHDGDLDLVAVNGRILRTRPHPETTLDDHWAPYAEPNQLFLNDGAGVYADAGSVCGPFCGDVEVSRGLAAGDLDEDGDVDLVVSNGNGTLKVYRNDAPRAGAWLVLRVIDPALRRDAVGAIVEVHAGEQRWRRPVGPAASYLSSHDPRVHFGLGPVTSIDAVVVRWPGGSAERFEGTGVNERRVIRRGAGVALP